MQDSPPTRRRSGHGLEISRGRAARPAARARHGRRRLADARKIEEAQGTGQPLGRPWLKRAVYSLLWIVPIVVVLNLTIRLIVGSVMADPRAIAAFYKQYSVFVYAFDLAVWLALCLAGVLPGTARQR